jgi:uncharacterized membrane protein YhaH (DUF805 family)
VKQKTSFDASGFWMGIGCCLLFFCVGCVVFGGIGEALRGTMQGKKILYAPLFFLAALCGHLGVIGMRHKIARGRSNYAYGMLLGSGVFVLLLLVGAAILASQEMKAV